MEFVLGTVCGINLYEYGSGKLYARIFSRVREIDRTMGVRTTDFQELLGGGIVEPDSAAAQAAEDSAAAIVSGIVKINENAGVSPVKVRADIIEVLERAKYYAELSGGAFDPTVGPLVNLWGIGTGGERIPGREEIARALALVNWRDLIIDAEARTAFLRRPGMALDLGAIAKGYAADEAVRLAREGGVKHALFDFGGNIAALGAKNSGGKTKTEAVPWRIGIQDPLIERGNYIGVLTAQDKSIVTSGVYERYFESDGRRYHHILSTTDGFPVNNGLLSVTIIADKSIDADGLSTAVFALGHEKGRALVNSIPGAGAVFIFDDRAVRITGNLRDTFALTSDEYTLAE
jgi:thiamine biosynthesis lipoprotein